MTRPPDVLLHVLLLLFAGALVVVAEVAELDDEVCLLQRSLEARYQEARFPAAHEPALLGRAFSASAAPAANEGQSLVFVCHRLFFWDSYLIMCMMLFDGVGILLVWMALSWSRNDQGHKLPGVQNMWLGCFAAVVLLLSTAIVVLLVTCRFGTSGHLEFVHIPKNAGTAVETAGLEADIMWSRFSFSLLGKRHMSDGNMCNAYHIPPWMLDRSPYKDTTAFCVTRHPYDRAVSEYTYLLSDLADWSHEFAEEYDTGLYDREPCTARGLNHFVRRTGHLFKRGLKYIDDCHHLPQSQYIWDYSGGEPGRQICKEVLRLDHLDQGFATLMGKYGYQVVLPKKPEFRSADYCDVSAADLDEESRQLLRELYADDFRLLNYSAY